MKELKEAIKTLRRVLDVIETADSETPEDTVEMLLELDEDIRDLILDVEGAYPKTRKKLFDINSPAVWDEA